MTKQGPASAMRQKCPNCGAFARVMRSEEVAPATRDMVFQCTDDDCRTRWRAQLEPVALIVEPENPRPGFLNIFPARRGRKPAPPDPEPIIAPA